MKPKPSTLPPASNIFVLLANTGFALTDPKVINQPEDHREKFFQVVCHLVKICTDVPTLNQDFIDPEEGYLINKNEHSEALRFLNQVRKVSEFMGLLGMGKFSVVDHLLHINKQKAGEIINELVRYYSYKKSMIDDTKFFKEKIEARGNIIERMREELEATRHKFENLKRRKQMEKPRYDQAMNALDEKFVNTNKLRSQILDKVPFKHEAELQLDALNGQMERIKWDQMMVDQTNQELTKKLSKTSLQTLTRMKTELQESMVESKRQIEQQGITNNEKIKAVTEKFNEYSIVYDHVRSTITRYNEVSHRNLQMKGVINHMLSNIQQQKQNIQNIKASISQGEASVISMHQREIQYNTNIAETKQQLQTSKTILKTFSAQDKEKIQMMEHMKSQLERLEKVNEESMESFREYSRGLERRLEELEKSCHDYFVWKQEGWKRIQAEFYVEMAKTAPLPGTWEATEELKKKKKNKSK